MAGGVTGPVPQQGPQQVPGDGTGAKDNLQDSQKINIVSGGRTYSMTLGQLKQLASTDTSDRMNSLMKNVHNYNSAMKGIASEGTSAEIGTLKKDGSRGIAYIDKKTNERVVKSETEGVAESKAIECMYAIMSIAEDILVDSDDSDKFITKDRDDTRTSAGDKTPTSLQGFDGTRDVRLNTTGLTAQSYLATPPLQRPKLNDAQKQLLQSHIQEGLRKSFGSTAESKLIEGGVNKTITDKIYNTPIQFTRSDHYEARNAISAFINSNRSTAEESKVIGALQRIGLDGGAASGEIGSIMLALVNITPSPPFPASLRQKLYGRAATQSIAQKQQEMQKLMADVHLASSRSHTAFESAFKKLESALKDPTTKRLLGETKDDALKDLKNALTVSASHLDLPAACSEIPHFAGLSGSKKLEFMASFPKADVTVFPQGQQASVGRALKGITRRIDPHYHKEINVPRLSNRLRGVDVNTDVFGGSGGSTPMATPNLGMLRAGSPANPPHPAVDPQPPGNRVTPKMITDAIRTLSKADDIDAAVATFEFEPGTSMLESLGGNNATTNGYNDLEEELREFIKIQAKAESVKHTQPAMAKALSSQRVRTKLHEEFLKFGDPDSLGKELSNTRLDEIFGKGTITDYDAARTLIDELHLDGEFSKPPIPLNPLTHMDIDLNPPSGNATFRGMSSAHTALLSDQQKGRLGATFNSAFKDSLSNKSSVERKTLMKLVNSDEPAYAKLREGINQYILDQLSKDSPPTQDGLRKLINESGIRPDSEKSALAVHIGSHGNFNQDTPGKLSVDLKDLTVGNPSPRGNIPSDVPISGLSGAQLHQIDDATVGQIDKMILSSFKKLEIEQSGSVAATPSASLDDDDDDEGGVAPAPAQMPPLTGEDLYGEKKAEVEKGLIALRNTMLDRIGEGQKMTPDDVKAAFSDLKAAMNNDGNFDKFASDLFHHMCINRALDGDLSTQFERIGNVKPNSPDSYNIYQRRQMVNELGRRLELHAQDKEQDAKGVQDGLDRIGRQKAELGKALSRQQSDPTLELRKKRHQILDYVKKLESHTNQEAAREIDKATADDVDGIIVTTATEKAEKLKTKAGILSTVHQCVTAGVYNHDGSLNESKQTRYMSALESLQQLAQKTANPQEKKSLTKASEDMLRLLGNRDDIGDPDKANNAWKSQAKSTRNSLESALGKLEDKMSARAGFTGRTKERIFSSSAKLSGAKAVKRARRALQAGILGPTGIVDEGKRKEFEDSIKEVKLHVRAAINLEKKEEANQAILAEVNGLIKGMENYLKEGQYFDSESAELGLTDTAGDKMAHLDRQESALLQKQRDLQTSSPDLSTLKEQSAAFIDGHQTYSAFQASLEASGGFGLPRGELGRAFSDVEALGAPPADRNLTSEQRADVFDRTTQTLQDMYIQHEYSAGQGMTSESVEQCFKQPEVTEKLGEIEEAFHSGAISYDEMFNKVDKTLIEAMGGKEVLLDEGKSRDDHLAYASYSKEIAQARENIESAKFTTSSSEEGAGISVGNAPGGATGSAPSGGTSGVQSEKNMVHSRLKGLQRNSQFRMLGSEKFEKAGISPNNEVAAKAIASNTEMTAGGAVVNEEKLPDKIRGPFSELSAKQKASVASAAISFQQATEGLDRLENAGDSLSDIQAIGGLATDLEVSDGLQLISEGRTRDQIQEELDNPSVRGVQERVQLLQDKTMIMQADIEQKERKIKDLQSKAMPLNDRLEQALGKKTETAVQVQAAHDLIKEAEDEIAEILIARDTALAAAQALTSPTSPSASLSERAPERAQVHLDNAKRHHASLEVKVAALSTKITHLIKDGSGPIDGSISLDGDLASLLGKLQEQVDGKLAKATAEHEEAQAKYNENERAITNARNNLDRDRDELEILNAQLHRMGDQIVNSGGKEEGVFESAPLTEANLGLLGNRGRGDDDASSTASYRTAPDGISGSSASAAADEEEE